MPFAIAAAVMGGTSLLSGVLGASAAKSAAHTQADAANRATDTQLQMFNTINSQQTPWRQAGENALGGISSMWPQFLHSFNGKDLKSNLAPNYQWQLGQGLGALKNAANVQTGLLSGNTLRAVNDYAQNFAGNAYQQAFNNYNAQQTNIFNRLSNVAGLGQTANQTTAQAGTAAAGNAGNAMMAAGAANASGIVGSTNAMTGALNNAASWYSLPKIAGWGQTGGGTPSEPWAQGNFDDFAAVG